MLTEQWKIPEWDRVEVERAIGSRRPDIVLLRDGVLVGAVEVLVSNPISVEKAADFARDSVPWIEVQASPFIYSGQSPWSVSDPLLIERMQPAV